MAAPIKLREDFDSPALRVLARRTRDATQIRRLVALAEIYDGGRRGDAARIGGVTLQIVRDRVLRFNARGPDGLIDARHPGPRRKLNDARRAALVKVVETGPIPAVHPGRPPRPSTAWRAGGAATWRSGSGMSSASRWRRPPSGAN